MVKMPIMERIPNLAPDDKISYGQRIRRKTSSIRLKLTCDASHSVQMQKRAKPDAPPVKSVTDCFQSDAY